MLPQEAKNAQSGSSKDKAAPRTPTTPKANLGVPEVPFGALYGSESSSSGSSGSGIGAGTNPNLGGVGFTDLQMGQLTQMMSMMIYQALEKRVPSPKRDSNESSTVKNFCQHTPVSEHNFCLCAFPVSKHENICVKTQVLAVNSAPTFTG